MDWWKGIIACVVMLIVMGMSLAEKMPLGQAIRDGVISGCGYLVAIAILEWFRKRK